ncbi:hypothetical protein CDCA_CDCA01G0004 [Cyanidium caldarium]|uniref:superoxide dismutase n=1 Tax=Cyanidium caldarium TaxID=2771 RepID=A0AAV9INZ6_CYACA|nr:hypothetical protein CDCA_CDCA01G0004 [Cyanidium caldarium]
MTTTGANALSSGTESVGFVLSTGGLRPHLHVPRTGSAVHRLRGHGLDQDTPASAAAVASRGLSRRQALQTLLAAPLWTLLSRVHPPIVRAAAAAPASTQYQLPLPPLPYPYNALEPVIDAKTMHLHHDKHLAGYVTKLNAALDEQRLRNFPAILGQLSNIGDAKLRSTVRNQGGGVVNHVQFFESLRSPAAGSGADNRPSGALAQAIEQRFGSWPAFQEQFGSAAKSLFGSGWVWLYETRRGGLQSQLEVGAFPNQDSPLMNGDRPILGLDVWEHAYYLKYGPNRGEYVDAWWRVINWPAVQRVYESRK